MISFYALYPIYFAVVLHGLMPTNENEMRINEMSLFVLDKTFQTDMKCF